MLSLFVTQHRWALKDEDAIGFRVQSPISQSLGMAIPYTAQEKALSITRLSALQFPAEMARKMFAHRQRSSEESRGSQERALGPQRPPLERVTSVPNIENSESVYLFMSIVRETPKIEHVLLSTLCNRQ